MACRASGRLLASAMLFLMASGVHAAGAPAQQETDAAAVHAATLVLDPHVDLPAPYGGANAAAPAVRDQASLDLLVRGGLDAVTFAVFVPQGESDDAGLARAAVEAQAKLATIRALATEHPDRTALALTADDVRRIAAEGKVAVLVSILNAYPLGRDASGLAAFHRDGVRILGLTHAGNNLFADSSRPKASDTPNAHGGLSAAGRALVAEANRLGVLLDVSQLTPAAFAQVLALSRAPVIATHSGVRARADVPRNLGNEELDLLRRNDGVVAIVAFAPYLKPVPADVQAQIAAVRARYGAVNGYEGLSEAQRAALTAETQALAPKVTVADLVDSIDYAVQRIGIDHVAISSDFNHGGGVVGWADEGEAAGVTAELVRRGYSAADIGKLWSGNVLRVLQAAQAAAAR